MKLFILSTYVLYSLYNFINILASMLRQLESRSHSDELAEEYSEPSQIRKLVLFANGCQSFWIQGCDIIRCLFVSICMWFHFQSYSQVQSLNDPFVNTLSVSCKIHKVQFEIYYGTVKFLSRDEIVVELSQLLIYQTITCKCVYFQANLQVQFAILKDFPKLWENLHKHLLNIRYLIGLLQLFKTLI